MIKYKNSASQNNLLLNILFWFGFLIYTINYSLMISGVLINNITTVLQVFGGLLMIFTSTKILNLNLKNNYLRITITLFICWNILIIIRGVIFDYEFFRELITDGSLGIFLYFTPFLTFIKFKIKSFYFISNLIIYLSIAFLIIITFSLMDIFNPQNVRGQIILEYLSRYLALPVTFILLSFPYQKKKKLIFSLIILFLTLILALIRARRGLIFSLALPMIFAYLFYIFRNQKFYVSKFLLTLIIIIPILLYFTLNLNSNNLLNLLLERYNEDTRSKVELFFYADLNNLEWLIGKGIGASYYCPTGLTPNGYRTVIETGYLQIILNGGIISIIFFILISLPAIYLGLIKSNNFFSKLASLWIILWMLNSYPSTVTAFNLYYIIYWLSISICYDKNIRELSDESIIKLWYSKI